MAIAQPLFINIPFSNSGLKTATIPNNDDSGVGNASWEQGFPPETMKQIIDGGVPPRGQDMNGVLNKITLILQYLQSGTPFKYNSTFASSIGGYPKGALVLSTDNETIWRNTVAGNTTDPDNGGTNWVNFLAQFGNYLPLAGGTMTGPISKNGVFVQNTGQSSLLVFYGGTSNSTGSYLTLFGMSHASNPGNFRLTAADGTSSTNLIGKPDGTLTWSGPVPAASTDSTQLATTAYVKDCLPKSIGSSTKLTYTNSNGVLTASDADVGSSDVPVFLSDGVITASGKKFSDYLPLTGGTLTGNLSNAASYFKTALNVDLSTTSTSSRETTAFIITRNPVDTTNNGSLLGIHASQPTNSQNLEIGIRVANPRAGNLPTSGTNVRTSNCWDKVGLRYNYALNQAYAYTSNPPVLDASDNRYYANHLATVGNLKTALEDYLPLTGGTLTGPLNVSNEISYIRTDAQNAWGLHIKNTKRETWWGVNDNGLAGIYDTTNTSWIINRNSNGYFNLYANNGTASKLFQGMPDGTLTWDGSDIYVENRTNVSTADDAITRSGTSNWLRFTGGETAYDDGASLTLYGRTHASNAGVVQLTTYDGTNRRSLVAKPDGTLTWSGPVVTASDDSTKIATTAYVKDCLPKSIGSSTKLTYTNSNGVLTASDANVGSVDVPVYLKAGVLTAADKSFGDYLPLAGGTMTGRINAFHEFAYGIGTTEYLRISGGNNGGSNAYDGGASLWLHGKDQSSYGGQFRLRSYNSSTSTGYNLLGTHDGVLTWSGPVVTTSDDSNKLATTAYVKDCVPKSRGSTSQPVYSNANGVITACTMNSASAAGLTRITNQAFGVYSDETHRNGFSYGYVKFASGLIIQWGCIYRTNGGTSAVTFETAYVNKPQITFSYDTEGDHTNSIQNITKTGFDVHVNTDASAATVKWMAIGI